jgi:hypothetical protein
MTAEQAKEYRIVDEVISSRTTTRPDPEGAVTAGRVDVLIPPQKPARRAQS